MPCWMIHLVNARRQLGPRAEVIRQACAEAEQRMAAVATPLALDIVVSGGRPGGGALLVSGHCFEPGVIGLRVDLGPGHAHESLHDEMLKALFHEAHHALRWEGPGYGSTLGGALVSEGLAQRFLHEMMDCPPEPFEVAVPISTCEAYRPHALARFDDADYDHEGWFFGAAAVPNWLGYTLGKRMVDRFLAAHPQMTALRLAHADTEIFRQTLAAPF
ncbi:MAG: hypothetical protein RJA94_1928 [Pseudomonadota bacterium]|jgi:hypothetical protein